MSIMGCLMFGNVQGLHLMFHLKNNAARSTSVLGLRWALVNRRDKSDTFTKHIIEGKNGVTFIQEGGVLPCLQTVAGNRTMKVECTRSIVFLASGGSKPPSPTHVLPIPPTPFRTAAPPSSSAQQTSAACILALCELFDCCKAGSRTSSKHWSSPVELDLKETLPAAIVNGHAQHRQQRCHTLIDMLQSLPSLSSLLFQFFA